MELLLVIIAALAPVALFLWYVYRQDKLQPEPMSQLLKAFFFGVLSCFVALVMAMPISFILGINDDEPGGVVEAILNSFCSAAIPEEIAKLLMLWLVLRKNRFFDEKVDGIIYAVCVGMGFAALENIMYLFNGLIEGEWVTIGIMRGLFSIPGHGLFAVLMGYYYSRYHFGIDRSQLAKWLILLAPILAHGIYDSLLIVKDVVGDSIIGTVLLFLFLYSFNRLRKMGQARIAEMRIATENDFAAQEALLAEQAAEQAAKLEAEALAQTALKTAADETEAEVEVAEVEVSEDGDFEEA